MALLPLNDTIFGEVIEVDENRELAEELAELTAGFGGHEFAASARAMEASLAPKKQPFQVRVTAVGPDCKELRIGDTAILIEGGGTMVTVLNDDGSFQRVYMIRERAVLACYRGDDAS